MGFTIAENARAVLLPAFDGLQLSAAVRRHLDAGGLSILLGESRAEYVGRAMDAQRRASETGDDLRRATEAARARSGLLLAAVDQEMGGICRLHDLVPPFPSHADLVRASVAEIEAIARDVAGRAAGWGINLFLAPVLDTLIGPNPWLEGRVWSNDPDTVARLSAAYVRGVQAGGVAATGKHFPGFRTTTGDPAVDATAISPPSIEEVEAGLAPFRAAIAAGVEMMMVGPAPVTAYDDATAALRSPAVVRVLREQLGFEGVVMADDLDSRATMRGDAVATVAVDALRAGCDFLLLADVGDQLDDVAAAITTAVATGAVSEEALARSADRLRGIARERACGSPGGGAAHSVGST